MKNNFQIIVSIVVSTYCLEHSDQSICPSKIPALFLSSISDSSAYNPVERRMAPLRKDSSGVILPFYTYGTPQLQQQNNQQGA